MQHLQDYRRLALTEQIQLIMSKVQVSAWRLQLHTPLVHATTPMIRGVWGHALRQIDRSLYDLAFAGVNNTGQNLPRYILRPAPPDPLTAPALDWILFGINQSHEPALWRAWDKACAMGLGPDRVPFQIWKRRLLAPDNLPTAARAWSLPEVTWPLPDDPASTPCVLKCEVPVRLIKRKQLIAAPTFVDLITGAVRRIAALAGLPRSEAYADIMRAAKSVARRTLAEPWVGEDCQVVRWSAAQQKEVKLYGVTGAMALPNGPGSFWPLLAAAQWTHIGKGTVFGMGELRIYPLSR